MKVLTAPSTLAPKARSVPKPSILRSSQFKCLTGTDGTLFIL